MTIHSMSLRIQFERKLHKKKKRIFVYDSAIFLNEYHTYT